MMGPLFIDRERSTIEIAGVTFPAADVICPKAEGQDDAERDRSLVGHDNVFVPAENGMLFEVIQPEPPAPAFRRWAITMWLKARTCELNQRDEVWLPRSVALCDGELVNVVDRPYSRPRGVQWWDDCDHEWVAETITRLSTKPFKPLPGPEVKVVPLRRTLEVVADG